MKEFISTFIKALLSSPWYWILLIGCAIIIFICIRYGERIANTKEKTKKLVNNIVFDKHNNNICPKCDGELVERTSKYGKFMGCVNYPRCKYIKK